jgi:hypothetical protein
MVGSYRLFSSLRVVLYSQVISYFMLRGYERHTTVPITGGNHIHATVGFSFDPNTDDRKYLKVSHRKNVFV